MNDRNCYCGLWESNPATLEAQGLPRGFCGTCDRCGQPGHTRHFPGAVPVTGGWCDRCYRIVRAQHVALHLALRLVIPAAVIALAVFISLWR